MADRYWVGGTGTWDASTTTNWSTSSGGSSGASAPTSADDVIIDTSSGTGTITCTSASAVCNNITVTASQAITLGGTLSLINGSLSYPSGGSFSSTALLTFIATTTGKTITSNGKSVSVVTFNGVGGSWQLQDALTSTSTVTLTNGTLDLNSKTLTCNTFISSNSNVREIAFGTGSINITGNNSTVYSVATATNFSYTGTSNITLSYSGSTGTRAIAPPGSASGGTEANTMNVNVIAGSDTINIGTTRTVKNFDFTGFTGTFTLTGAAWVFGNLTLSTGMTVGASAFLLSFKATSGTQIITSNSKTIDNAVTFDGIGGTFKLQDAMTVGTAYTTTLTNGALDLSNLTYTTGIFAGSNSNTRSIAFGTGNIIVTSNATTVWGMATATGFTFTGTPTVNFTYSGATGARVVQHGGTAGGTETNAISINVTAGTDSFVNSGAVKNLNFTGFSGILTNSTRTIYGNLTIPNTISSITNTAAWTFAATSGTQQITSNSNTLDFPLTFNGVGGTFRLEDNLTLGSTRTCTLTNGTLNVNSKTLTTGIFSSSNSNARTVAMGTNGKITVNGGNWTATTSTNLSLTGTGTIDMTFGTAKTFAGGGATYPYTLNQGGAGTLTITGANTFSNISNTVQPATIIFPASTTTTVSNFNVSGTAGNLVTINSSTAGTQSTLYKNTPNAVTVDYLNIKDSNATGLSGVLWFGGANSTNSGNNTNWLFISPEEGVASITGTGFLQAIGNRGQQGNGAINAYADVTGIGYRGQQGNASINANANVTALGNFSFSANGTINGYAYVVGLGNATYSGQGFINANATIIANGRIIGDEWVIVPYGSDTWLRQG